MKTDIDIKEIVLKLAGSSPSGMEVEEGHEFVHGNYEKVKAWKLLSALIPTELGGGGWSYSQMCYFLKELSQMSSSTALALSMHQHLVAANVWKFKKGHGGEDLLRKVATNDLVLVSTGAGDWLHSNGTLTRVEGGYRVSAKKHFASQAPVGNLLVTSARYSHPEKGDQVLHFGIPFSSQGVTIEDDWYSMGMRNTGSCTVSLDNVFVPDASISLTRQTGEFHPFWNVVLTAAMPLIMSVYVGIAEKAARQALDHAKKDMEVAVPVQIGELFNLLTTADVLWKDMIRITNDFDFHAANENGNAILIRKTLVSNACVQTTQKAFEIVGGKSYLQRFGMEKLMRDILAAHFHPLPEKEQQKFTGNYFLQNG